VKVLLWAVIAALSALLCFSFVGSISDVIDWRKTIEDSVVQPTYLETDPARMKTVPDFFAADPQGRPVHLSDFSSVNTLVVNIWSTSCPVCEEELPSLTEMDRLIGNTTDVALLTITIDEKWDDVAHLFPLGTNLRILFDPEQKVTKGIFGTTKYPETFILDKQRRIRARFDGKREWHLSEMINFVTSFSH
jgi:cytochrome c biogenesis protein CcmG/thiol:disulfide interchange protein DsbE